MADNDSTPITELPPSTGRINKDDLLLTSKRVEGEYKSMSISYSVLTSNISTDILPLVERETLPIYDKNLPLDTMDQDKVYSVASVSRFYLDTQNKIEDIDNNKLDRIKNQSQSVASEVTFNKIIKCPTSTATSGTDVVNVNYLNNKLNQENIVNVTEMWSDDTRWYKRYSNGWLEQGGKQITSSANNIQQVTFKIPFKDAKIFITATPCGTDLGDNGHQGIYTGNGYSITNQHFYYRNDLAAKEYIMWEAKGWEK